MIRDLDASPDPLPDYDVCIVGSGPAGMTVARELCGSGLSVAVLESGRLRPTRHGDRLRVVESDGIRIKDYSRERVLGGASSTWAGLSSPLDEVDLAPRPWMRHSGWPLARDELLPYWRAACERYRFAPLELYGPDGFGAVKTKGDRALAWEAVDEKIFLACAEPQHFGREHRAIFDADVDLWIDATVLRLERDGDRVARARLRSSGGREATVAARAFVLATGGIENARLLLASDGLGNERDQVGRYLMNHPKNSRGEIRLAEPLRELPYHFGCLNGGYAGYAGLRLREDLQREREVLNSYVRFEPLFPWSDKRGVEGFLLLVKRSKGLMRRFRARHADDLVTLRDYAETGDDSDLQNERKSALEWLGLGASIVVDAPSVARYLAARFREGRAPTVRTIRLRNFMEMEPDPDNRVTLGARTDPYGQPLPVVRHRPTDLDRRSMVALHAALADEVRANGLGELTSDLADAEPWPIDADASHHMGTTRMGDDPATSVVDRDARLHEVGNVWLAGASVFPTGGCANPTFTIVALAIRLAERLRGELA